MKFIIIPNNIYFTSLFPFFLFSTIKIISIDKSGKGGISTEAFKNEENHYASSVFPFVCTKHKPLINP